jgi:hypothetical protein
VTVTKTVINDVIVPEVFNPYVIESVRQNYPHFIRAELLPGTLNWTDWQAPAANYLICRSGKT